jgi:hypothetical protein
VAESQGPPETVLEEAVTNGLPVSLLTDRVWPTGSDPRNWYSKLRLDGEVDRLGRLVTEKVTSTISKLSTVVEETKMVPA